MFLGHSSSRDENNRKVYGQVADSIYCMRIGPVPRQDLYGNTSPCHQMLTMDSGKARPTHFAPEIRIQVT